MEFSKFFHTFFIEVGYNVSEKRETRMDFS